MDDQSLDDICRTIQDSSARLFIPYTCAYHVKSNRQACGEKKSDTEVYNLAERYEGSLIVEHDHHVYLPSELSGLGILRESTLKKIGKAAYLLRTWKR